MFRLLAEMMVSIFVYVLCSRSCTEIMERIFISSGVVDYSMHALSFLNCYRTGHLTRMGYCLISFARYEIKNVQIQTSYHNYTVMFWLKTVHLSLPIEYSHTLWARQI